MKDKEIDLYEIVYDAICKAMSNIENALDKSKGLTNISRNIWREFKKNKKVMKQIRKVGLSPKLVFDNQLKALMHEATVIRNRF